MHLIREKCTYIIEPNHVVAVFLFIFFSSFLSTYHPICMRHSSYGHNVSWLIFYYSSVNRILLLSLIISKIMTIRSLFSLFMRLMLSVILGFSFSLILHSQESINCLIRWRKVRCWKTRKIEKNLYVWFWKYISKINIYQCRIYYIGIWPLPRRDHRSY